MCSGLELWRFLRSLLFYFIFFSQSNGKRIGPEVLPNFKWVEERDLPAPIVLPILLVFNLSSYSLRENLYLENSRAQFYISLSSLLPSNACSIHLLYVFSGDSSAINILTILLSSGMLYVFSCLAYVPAQPSMWIFHKYLIINVLRSQLLDPLWTLFLNFFSIKNFTICLAA